MKVREERKEKRKEENMVTRTGEAKGRKGRRDNTKGRMIKEEKRT